MLNNTIKTQGLLKEMGPGHNKQQTQTFLCVNVECVSDKLIKDTNLAQPILLLQFQRLGGL